MTDNSRLLSYSSIHFKYLGSNREFVRVKYSNCLSFLKKVGLAYAYDQSSGTVIYTLK